MSLREYRHKRNFHKTSEPSGRRASHDGGLHFVVQKHDASHLHYDFRLENRGVLKSWAVPKGISDDPAVKRLAIEVEDHPLDYQYFEGSIPAGSYGAGTVEIWDNGEYYMDKNFGRRQNEEKIAEGLQKGHLKFTLEGKKLHGQYSLVRLHGTNGQKTSWFLRKKPSADGETPAIDLEAAPKAAMPRTVHPMLADLVDKPFDRKGWVFEVKWDGYRILAQIKDHKVRLYTRNDKDYTQVYFPVAEELKKLPDCILDGEVVVVDQEGISRFQLLQNYMRSKEGRLLYYVFDIVYGEGRDLHHLPLSTRRWILQKTVPQNLRTVRLSDYAEDKGLEFFKVAKKMGLEGIMAKNLQSPYMFGIRSRDWLKIKAVQEQEAVICGFTKPRGSRKYFGALILGLYDRGEFKYVGHTGGGFDEQTLRMVYECLKPLIIDKCPLKKKPATNMPVTWVEPKLLCEVKFQEFTEGGHMRQPIFLGLREDQSPQEAHPEIPQPLSFPNASVGNSKNGSPAKTFGGGHLKKVKFTHLDKIYWPQDGYTKGDMIKYYQDIADYILTYIQGRPQSLRRQPDGITTQGFFQKDIKFKPPEWVKIFKVESESKDEIIHHLICDDRESLAYMNNMGCIEVNTWCSTVNSPLRPDFLVLDFDPVDIDFSKLIDVVVESRKILKAAKCDGFCKTSGSRGLHVYIPLAKKYTYDQTKDFCQMICLAINRQMPDVTSLERMPHKRRGLIYLDYLQNHYTATMVAPYSLRPRPHAPVSAPLEWKEVRHGLTPQDFNIKNIFPRLKKKGDLWKGVIGPGIDMRKSLKLLEPMLK